MKTASGLAALLNWLLDYPRHEWIFRFLRWTAPLFRIPLTNIFIVTRYDDVREVLSRDQAFPVPWGEKMKGLTDGENFVLGMPRDEKYRLSYQQLAAVFRRDDVAQIVKPRAAQISEDQLTGKTLVDVIQDLMWTVPTRLTQDYYGIPIKNHQEFAYWTVAVSGYLFGPPFIKGDTAQARAAAGCLRTTIKDAIRKAKEAPKAEQNDQVLPRMIAANMADEVIAAQLFGMVLGFIPTNLIASGNMIDTLLHFPQFMEQARAAVADDDDQRLWRCLQEALRFRFINPGAWRGCAAQTTIAAGTSREAAVPAGATLLVSIQSAMFDEQRIELPHEFNPDRPAENYMTFGYGQHWCIGAYIAMAQITATFKALLAKEGLRRADGPGGQLRRITIYPAHLMLAFDS